MEKAPHRIDVHHHVLPDFYVEEMREALQRENGSIPLPTWSRDSVLSRMDDAGIAVAIMSISAPGVFRGDAAAAARLARRCNEFLAQMISDNPERIGGYGVLPLPDVDAALREAEYALDELRMDGIVLLTNYTGTYLGVPAFDELLAELDRRRAVVHVHPTAPAAMDRIALDIPPPILEFVFDTTRAISSLIYSGSLERYAGVRFIVSHAGGTVPFLAGRIRLGAGLPDARDKAPKGALHYLRALYYDTALSTAPSALRALQELALPERVLFGSDGGFAVPPVVAAMTKGLAEYDGLDDAGRRDVERNNALALFPRFGPA